MESITWSLISTVTEDGFILDGLRSNVPDPKGVVIHIHSSHANFYEGRFHLAVAEGLARVGYAYITTNNRGRDTLASLYKYTEGELGFTDVGGARELFDDCIFDISAWDAYARKYFNRVVYLGHSLGCCKLLWWNNARSPDLAGLILMSPPDLWGLARQKLTRFSEGRQEELMPGDPNAWLPDDAYFFPVTRGSFRSFFSDHSRLGVFDIRQQSNGGLELLKAIACPVVVTFGTTGEYIVGDASKYLQMISTGIPQGITERTIAGANHNYNLREEEIASAIADWIAEL